MATFWGDFARCASPVSGSLHLEPAVAPTRDRETVKEKSHLPPPTKTKSDSFCPYRRLARETSETAQNTLKLDHTALAAERYGVSDRAAALIVSSAFLDAQKAGLISEDQAKAFYVTDRSKIIRAKKRVGDELQNTECTESLYGMYFDGRKDETLINVKKGTTYHRTTIKESHISLVSEPDSRYIGHVSSTSGFAEDEFQAIWQHLETNSVDLEYLQVAGADGTNTNTGWKGGVIRKLEEKLERPLQWVICLLHFNELPFRSLFEHIDGVSKSPNTFSGPIGVLLPHCEDKPVVRYAHAPFPSCQLPDVPDPTELSSDQSYLYKISKAVISGHCPADVAQLQPGFMCKSRWLICANRILRLYISTEKQRISIQWLNTHLMFTCLCGFQLDSVTLSRMAQGIFLKSFKEQDTYLLSGEKYLMHPSSRMPSLLFLRTFC